MLRQINQLLFGRIYAVTSTKLDSGEVVHSYEGRSTTPFDRYVGEEFGKAKIQRDGVSEATVEIRSGGLVRFLTSL